MSIDYSPIGVVHTPFTDPVGMPIQPTGAVGVQGRIELEPAYVDGLQDLDGFSHVVLIYHFHRAKQPKMLVTPFLDTKSRGLFATRAPTRPNAIGLSVVKLLAIEGNVLRIENVDMLDGTPLLDIKPYIPDIEPKHVDRVGWYAEAKGKAKDATSYDRFGDGSSE
jgi:tRNA-Thr(GGU) m(6)t(6)A37 methyltransferase TsaA